MSSPSSVDRYFADFCAAYRRSCKYILLSADNNAADKEKMMIARTNLRDYIVKCMDKEMNSKVVKEQLEKQVRIHTHTYDNTRVKV